MVEGKGRAVSCGTKMRNNWLGRKKIKSLWIEKGQETVRRVQEENNMKMRMKVPEEKGKADEKGKKMGK